MQHLRKLGFGQGIEGENSKDPVTWIDEQLSAEFPDLGYPRSNAKSFETVSWPTELNFDLTERVNRALAYSTERRRIRKSAVSVGEKGAAMQAAREKYETRYPDQIKFSHAPLLGEHHFKLRLMHFWLNHFTVGFATTASNYLIGHFADEAIYAKLNGSFSDMLYAVETHPAMLTYLDNIYNIGEKSRRNRKCNCVGLNDNLARETMELHSVSPQRGYEEEDIRNAAKVFAGWGAPFDEKFPEPVSNYWNAFLQSRAEPGEKIVLGKTLMDGPDALRELTNHLASDPMTADVLSRKLTLHFLGESATEAEINLVRAAWEGSGGDLPSIHKAVALAALNSEGKKFLWPMTWLFQLIRISGSHLFAGFEEYGTKYFDQATRHPERVMGELGMDFWSIRQPNGFSDRKVDWISSEHFERRIRFAQMLYRSGQPTRSVDDIVDIISPGERTKAAIANTTSDKDRFIILACSKEFLEV